MDQGGGKRRGEAVKNKLRLGDAISQLPRSNFSCLHFKSSCNDLMPLLIAARSSGVSSGQIRQIPEHLAYRLPQSLNVTFRLLHWR
jgi:hypothetical protein